MFDDGGLIGIQRGEVRTVVDLTDATFIETGALSSCAAGGPSGARCWGDNSFAQFRLMAEPTVAHSDDDLPDRRRQTVEHDLGAVRCGGLGRGHM